MHTLQDGDAHNKINREREDYEDDEEEEEEEIEEDDDRYSPPHHIKYNKNYEPHKRTRRERPPIIPPHVLAQYPSYPLSFSNVSSPSSSPSLTTSPTSTSSSTSSPSISPALLSSILPSSLPPSPTKLSSRDTTKNYHESSQSSLSCSPPVSPTLTLTSSPSPPHPSSSPLPSLSSLSAFQFQRESSQMSTTRQSHPQSTPFHQPRPFLSLSHGLAAYSVTKYGSSLSSSYPITNSNDNNNHSNSLSSHPNSPIHSNSHNSYSHRKSHPTYNNPTNYATSTTRSPQTDPRLRLDPTFTSEPKCHITDFVVSLFEPDSDSSPRTDANVVVTIKGIRTRKFQLFANRCWATCVRMDAVYTSSRIQAVLDILQSIHHPNLATPAAHFPRGRYYFAVYPIYTSIGSAEDLTRRDLEQLWAGLQMLHRVGLRHGDVDVSSVMRNEDGVPVWTFCERALIEQEVNVSQDLLQFEKNIARALTDESELESENSQENNSNNSNNSNNINNINNNIVYKEGEKTERWHIVDESEKLYNLPY